MEKGEEAAEEERGPIQMGGNLRTSARVWPVADNTVEIANCIWRTARKQIDR